MNQLRNFNVSPRNKILLNILVFGIFVFPFLALSFFSQPYLDDYVMPVYMREVGGWFEWQKIMFSTYSGRYFSTLIYLISPTNYFHPELYWIVPFLLILSTVAIFTQSFRKIFNLDFGISFLLANLCFGLIFGLSFSVFELLFWTASSLFYWLSFLLLLSFLIQLQKLNNSNKPSLILRISVLLLLTAILGTNEISAVFTVILLAFYLMIKFKFSRLQNFDFQLLFLSGFIMLLLVFFTGNAERIHNFEHNRQLFWSLGRAFEVGFKSFAYQFQSPAFITASIGFLLISKRLRKNIQLPNFVSHIKSWWILGFGIFTILLSYFIAYFILGNNPAWRVHAIIQVNFLLVWTFFLFKIGERLEKTLGKLNEISILKYLILALFIWFSLTDFSYKQQETRPITFRNNLPRVWYELIFEAPKFYQENQNRLLTLKAAKEENLFSITFPPFSKPPESLFFEDLSTDSTAHYNIFYARYFGFKSAKVVDKLAKCPLEKKY